MLVILPRLFREQLIEEKMMPSYSVTPDSVRECLIGEHYASAQQMPVQIYDAVAPTDGDLLGDWELQGVFINDEQYRGSLSGLGIRLEPGLAGGLVALKALAEYRPLMPEAYRALHAMKADSSTGGQALQPWTRLIGFALEGEASMTLQEADNSWLEGALDGYHCRYVRTSAESLAATSN
ncbi:hypothetical protein CR157_21560 [Halomonas sp. LBP4]|nr:hypothetical protein CR157_21560 [Halomonas sp. LBP4]